MHLSTYQINKDSKNFVHEPQSDSAIFAPNSASKRTLTSVFKQLEDQGLDIASLNHAIEHSCHSAMQMVTSMISHNCYLMKKQEPKALGKLF